MDHCILLSKHLSNHMHFITNGYKRFLKTNSTDPRQRVPLSIRRGVQLNKLILTRLHVFLDNRVYESALKDLGTFCNTKHNVHRFTLNLVHSLKIMIIQSFLKNISC